MELISKKIIQAFILKEKIETVLLKTKEFSELLHKLKTSIQTNNGIRNSIGLSKICSICGSHKKDCCGRGVELRYSAELLALNILFGITIPPERRFPDSCYFLSENGCILFVRDIFCINFLCDKVRNSLQLKSLKRLWEHEGLETSLIFRAEEYIKRRLSTLLLHSKNGLQSLPGKAMLCL